MTKKARKRGRPPGSRNTSTITREFACLKVSITEHGGRRKVSMAEVFLRQLRNLALQGDIAAQKLVEKVRHTLNPEADSEMRYGVLLAPGMQSEQEWIRRAEIENQYKTMPTYEEEYAPLSPNPVDKPVEKASGERSAGEAEPDPKPRARYKRVIR
ncbi:MAG: DUF5681 domain-containing protein [Sphingobium sp.]